jgi:hypothetical protein
LLPIIYTRARKKNIIRYVLPKETSVDLVKAADMKRSLMFYVVFFSLCYRTLYPRSFDTPRMPADVGSITHVSLPSHKGYKGIVLNANDTLFASVDSVQHCLRIYSEDRQGSAPSRLSYRWHLRQCSRTV